MATLGGEDTRDLASLASLTEDTLVDALKHRFNADLIYTYIGDILVAINPFRPIDGLYSPSKQGYYGAAAPSQHFDDPHTFAVASRAYRAMCSLNSSQCIVVNGESGAGKTESAKQMASQLIFMCNAGSHGTALEQRILKINPILEGFGNAQTLMNDNSSRFGKYMELLFTEEGKLTGALLSEYLLEKSRVTRQAPGEQNFHVLYYIFAMDGAASMGLTSPLEFEYLQAAELEDTQDLAVEVEAALAEVGFTDDETTQIKKLLAGVLYLGNVGFEPDGDGVRVNTSTSDALAKVSELLGITEEALRLALVQATAHTRNEVIVRHYTEEQAIDARDAMAKAVYSRLFSWLVYRINRVLCPEDLAAAARIGQLEGLCTSIGILDIFGFEHFDHNGFEQWCINLANEQLQHFFNQHVFTLEMEEYRKEGIDASDVTFLDNTPILNMYLEKPLGLLSLLDEESVFPRATDSSLVAKFVRNFGKHDHFQPSLTNRPIFDIRHYAGDVTYSAQGFLEKNRDRLATDVVTALQSSTLQLMTDMFFGRITETGRLEPMVIKPTYGRATVSRKMHSAKQYVSGVSKRPPSVSQHFRNSLSQLVAKMKQCSPHFVRCIKPNTNKAPWIFEKRYITLQLRYTGVLDTIRIRREGYSWRPKFQEFVDAFRTLAFAWDAKPPASKESCLSILKKAGITSGFKMGHTKVFLKYFHKDTLLTCMDDFQNAARVLQKVIVGHLSRRRLRHIISERETQAAQVSAFLELLELRGEGAAAAVGAQDRMDDQKKHLRRKEEEERMKQEEEERKQREKARAEAEQQLYEKISKLESERQAKAQETEEMLRHAREEAQRREELEQLLQAEKERVLEQTQKQLQERLEAETKLQQEQEKAMAEKQKREEAEEFYAQQLQEERERREQEEARLKQEQLKAEQGAREAEERAQAQIREKEEARMMEQQEFQQLISQLGAARDAAEQELRAVRDEKEALALELKDAKHRLNEAKAELAQEVAYREEVEARYEESSELLTREGLMKSQAEETSARLAEQNNNLKRSLANAEERVQNLKSQLSKEETRRRTIASKVQALEQERQRLKTQTLKKAPSKFEEKQEQLKQYMDRMEALRCQARGIVKPGINLGIAHLADHVKESLGKHPDEQLLSITKTRAAGYLEKQGEVRTAWRKRFFVLDLKKHSLFYCTDDTCSTIKGAIQTAEMLFVAPAVDEPTGFIIGTPRRNYVMRAATVPLRDAWIEAVRVCLPESGRKLTSSEHVLQAEAVRAEYEERLSVLRSQVRSLEHKLEREKIKRVDADIRAKSATDEKEKAQKHRAQLQASYMEQLVSAAAQKEKTATLPKDAGMPTVDNEQRVAIYQVAHLQGRCTQTDIDKLDVRGFLRSQLGADAIPSRLVVTQWGLQGHLVKLGSFMKTWKRRWFSLDLRKGTLAYYPDENTNSELGHILLVDVCDVVVPQSPEAKSTNTFLVVTSKRTFHLRADTPSIMLCWFHLLTAATEEADSAC